VVRAGFVALVSWVPVWSWWSFQEAASGIRARSPLAAGFPAKKASSRSALPVAEAARAGAASKAEGSAPAAASANASSTHCRVLWGGQTGSGETHGCDVLGPIRAGCPRWQPSWPGSRRSAGRRGCSGSAGAGGAGGAAPARPAPAAGHPARLRTGHGRESHGRKPAHQVSPLATFSQRHAKLMRTHSSERTPLDKKPH
jgi:hypothetical protein